jgi:hypothetical protein
VKIIPNAELCVEAFMSNTPQPTGYVVRAEGRTIAVLTHEQVKEAFEQYGAMVAVAARERNKRAARAP